jgi:hypothetical protein
MMSAMFEVARRRGLRTSLLACGAAIAAITAATLSRTLVQAHLPALLLPALLFSQRPGRALAPVRGLDELTERERELLVFALQSGLTIPDEP